MDDEFISTNHIQDIKKAVNPIFGYVAGICSGATKLAIGHPFDTVKVRLQVEGSNGKFKGPLDCLLKTIRREGFFALYKGATPPLLGWTVMDSVQMATLRTLRNAQLDGNKDGQLSISQHALAGAGAGIVVSFVATPIEQIKGRLQIQYDSKQKLYTGPIDCGKKLVQNNGFQGLFKGLTPCLGFRSFFWVLWGSYEFYSQQLEKSGISKQFIPFLAGGMAANTFWTLSFPFDVIKNKMMTQPDTKPAKFPSMSSCFRYIYKTDGWKGFYRGFVPCFLRSFPTNGAAIFVYESIVRLQ